MSLAGYFFGNVDKSGKLEDVTEEFRETIESLNNSEQLVNLFSATKLGVDEKEAKGDENAESADEEEEEEVNFATIKSDFRHADDAQDFSDITEVIVESPASQMFNARYLQRGLSTLNTGANGTSSPLQLKTAASRSRLDEDYDAESDEEVDTQQKLEAQQKAEEPKDLLQRQVYYQQLRDGTKTIIPATIDQSQAAAPTVIDVRSIYPAFEENKILKFSDLFNTKRLRRSYVSKARPAQFPSSSAYVKDVDQRKLFNTPEDPQTSADTRINNGYYEEEQSEERERRKSLAWRVPETRDFYAVQLESWEDKIIWDDKGKETNERSQVNTGSKSILTIRNYEFENGDWEDSIVWDEHKPYKPFTTVTLNLNDTNVLFDLASNDNTLAMGHDYRVKRGKKNMTTYRVLNSKLMPSEEEMHRKLDIDRFNISNDRFYEAHKEGKFHRVRQTFGQLVVQHALPALKLLQPWFKNKLTKSELRSFHRPILHFPPGTEATFSRVKGSKKKKQKRKELGEIMRSSKDLTLKDHSNFVLMEYSEEHPSIVQNVGMGSLLLNYYRKVDPEDPTVPQSDIGDPFVLDVADASPFMNFGNVEGGQTITALYNNLVRAPAFRQPARNTDFLVIRNTHKGETKYFIRDIPHLFTVGQAYPVQEVPGPHSRKITTMVKNRLQITAFRFIRKDNQHRLKFTKMVKAYPEYSDIQLRQRLKEFAEYQRKGTDTGYWKLKGNVPLPSEEDIRKLVTPEMVCLYESMLVGQRHLLDAGYGRAADGDEENATEESESKMDIEEQLAPWITTRNFLNATQGKAMLKLWGPGDPTGRGEGFSFVRVSMKDIFLRQGESAEEKLAQIEARPKSAHRYNVAEQQLVYKEEISRIWNAQFQALSNQEEIEAGEEEAEEENTSEIDEDESYWRPRRESSQAASDAPTPHHHGLFASRHHRGSPSPSVFGSTRDRDDDDNASVAGSMSSRTSYNAGSSRNKYLIIKRLVRGANGETSWQSETVRDPAVINTYIRNRQMIEEQNISTEALEPTDDAEKNKRMRKRIEDQLAKLKRNQERRIARAAAKGITLPEAPITAAAAKKELAANSTVRRCGNCGQLGHMKTNKKCPLFVDPAGPSPAGSGSMTPGGSILPRQGSNPPGMAGSSSRPGTPGPSGEYRQGSPMMMSPRSDYHGGSGDYMGAGGNGGDGTMSTGSNKISIPKSLMDMVANQEKESLTVRLPTNMLMQQASSQSMGPQVKRKRSETNSSQSQISHDHFIDYIHPPVKSYGRRKKPEVELANLIDTILGSIMAMQEATSFLHPVNPKLVPDYHTLIKDPRDLNTMRDASKNSYVYRSADAFLTDLRIMVNNSLIYNGDQNPYTMAARACLGKAEEMIAAQGSYIQQLEQDILEADIKSGTPTAEVLQATHGLGHSRAGSLSGTNGTPPLAPGALIQLVHPGGYGAFSSTTFPGIGKVPAGVPLASLNPQLMGTTVPSLSAPPASSTPKQSTATKAATTAANTTTPNTTTANTSTAAVPFNPLVPLMPPQHQPQMPQQLQMSVQQQQHLLQLQPSLSTDFLTSSISNAFMTTSNAAGAGAGSLMTNFEVFSQNDSNASGVTSNSAFDYSMLGSGPGVTGSVPASSAQTPYMLQASMASQQHQANMAMMGNLQNGIHSGFLASFGQTPEQQHQSIITNNSSIPASSFIPTTSTSSIPLPLAPLASTTSTTSGAPSTTSAEQIQVKSESMDLS